MLGWYTDFQPLLQNLYDSGIPAGVRVTVGASDERIVVEINRQTFLADLSADLGNRADGGHSASILMRISIPMLDVDGALTQNLVIDSVAKLCRQ